MPRKYSTSASLKAKPKPAFASTIPAKQDATANRSMQVARVRSEASGKRFDKKLKDPRFERVTSINPRSVITVRREF